MNMRECAWRKRVAWMIGLLDERIEALGIRESPLEVDSMLALRERLAGALGAECGMRSTKELRRRAARDFAEAVERLDLPSQSFEPPLGQSAGRLVERDLASFRPALPKTGDPC